MEKTQPSNVLRIVSTPPVQTVLFIAWFVAKREKLHEYKEHFHLHPLCKLSLALV